jgi:hypothetical protein
LRQEVFLSSVSLLAREKEILIERIFKFRLSTFDERMEKRSVCGSRKLS